MVVYFAAYGLKGEELRINKIDLVEVDLVDSKQVYGSTWFSLFSPRVAAYTVGLEPASDTWTAPVPAGAPGPVVTLLEAGDTTTRAGSQALFRRPYEYADEEAGLYRVPVPVWSTRSFKASWRAPLRAKTPAIGTTDDAGPIRKARAGSGLAGRITNNLGVKLTDVALFYQSRWYTLGTLEPGERKQVEPLFAADAQGQNRDVGAWFTGPTLAPGPAAGPVGPAHRRGLQGGLRAGPTRPSSRCCSSAPPSQDHQTNAGLRRFDQTWRLRELPQYPPPDRAALPRRGHPRRPRAAAVRRRRGGDGPPRLAEPAVARRPARRGPHPAPDARRPDAGHVPARLHPRGEIIRTP